jgi:hypothetical protein
MNGKPGDHPLTDILVHNLAVFSPEVDALIKEIISLGGGDALEARYNLFSPPSMNEFEDGLRHMLFEVKEDAKRRGWEIE